MKAIEQCFAVVLFMLYTVVLTFEAVDEKLLESGTTQVKAIEQYFPVVLFIYAVQGFSTF